MLRIVSTALGLALAMQAATVPPRPQTGFLFDEVYRRHLVGDAGHPERPERLTAVLGGLERAGLLDGLVRVPARPATDDELAREIEPLGSFFNDLWEDVGEDVDVRFDEVTGPERNVLDAHTVEEAMTRAPIFEVPGETSLPATAEFMRSHAIHRVMVTDRGALVGIVTRTDLSNAVADHKLREHEYVFGTDPRLPRLDPRKPPHIERTLGSRLEHTGDTNKE